MIVERYKAPGNKAATISPGNIPQDSRSLEIRGHLAPRQGTKRNPAAARRHLRNNVDRQRSRITEIGFVLGAIPRAPWRNLDRCGAAAAHRGSEGPFNFRCRTNGPVLRSTIVQPFPKRFTAEVLFYLDRTLSGRSWVIGIKKVELQRKENPFPAVSRRGRQRSNQPARGKHRPWRCVTCDTNCRALYQSWSRGFERSVRSLTGNVCKYMRKVIRE